MEINKKGFLLYKDNYDPIKDLSIKEKAELLDAIFEYNILGKTKKLSTTVKIIFGFLKQQFDRDIERYNKICVRNKENIERRWGNKKNTKNTSGISGIPDDTKNTHKDKDTDTHKDKDKDTDTDKDIIPPFANAHSDHDIPDNWKNTLESWFEYKSEKRQKYKSAKTRFICFKKLFDLSRGDLSTAEKIINQSIANNWAGLFNLKNGEGGGSGGKHTNKFTGTLDAARELISEIDDSETDSHFGFENSQYDKRTTESLVQSN